MERGRKISISLLTFSVMPDGRHSREFVNGTIMDNSISGLLVDIDVQENIPAQQGFIPWGNIHSVVLQPLPKPGLAVVPEPE